MGAKTWMLVSAEEPAKDVLRSYPLLDRASSEILARELFPDEILEPIGDASLEYTSPPDDEVYIGCFEDLVIVAAKEFGIDYPSQLSSKFLNLSEGKYVYLHAMHSVVDWFAFAMWEDSKLKRSLSISPDSGILEDHGEKLSFEEPYWAGKHPVFEPGEEDEEYPFKFHPLELGEAALSSLFGYFLEGIPEQEHISPEDITLVAFRRVASLQKAKPWWKFW